MANTLEEIGSKHCQRQNEPSKYRQQILFFCKSDVISQNLVTLFPHSKLPLLHTFLFLSLTHTPKFFLSHTESERDEARRLEQNFKLHIMTFILRRHACRRKKNYA